MPSNDENQTAGSEDTLKNEVDGVPTFPPGTSKTHRRRLLKAMAGGSTVALAGCLGLGTDSAQFEMRNLSPSATEALGGETIEISVEIENTGGQEATRLLEIRLEGERIASRDITLGPGQRDIATFELTAPNEVDDYEFGFYLNGTEATGTITVTATPDPAFFAVDLDVDEQPPYRGEFEVGGRVENTGELPETKPVSLQFDGEELVSDEFELGAGETAEFSETVGQDPPGSTHTAIIESPNDTDERAITVWEPDYTAIDHMVSDVAPKTLVKDLNVQVAYDDEQIYFRYQWEQPDPGGWLHDLIYYDGDAGEWRRLADWDPWALDDDYGVPQAHEGYYEDRLSWMWHDGTLETDDGNKPFEQYGGWMTVMEGVRTLPGEASEEAVVNHPHFGEDGLGRSDMRKFIPQSRNGEWWEHDWDDPRSEAELNQMLEDGEYIDFPFWRAHRSNPMGYGTNHHVLDYRHGNVSGDRTFGTQGWDPDDGPELMFDPDVVDGGAIDRNEVVDEDGNPLDSMPDQQDFDQYALMTGGENENAVEFDPEVAEWDGAMIPRRPQGPASESGASWQADGVWENGTWEVEMWRELDTGYVDDMPVEEGETYTFSPALHHGFSQRWHWVAYPLKLGLGEDAELPDRWDEEWEHPDEQNFSTLIRAEEVDGEPDWDEIQTYTIPLMYPGLTDWTWLTSGEHPRVDEIRDAGINIWEHHDENPEDFADRMIELEEMMAPRK